VCKITFFISTSIDGIELIKDKKEVVTKDNQTCGNIIREDKENIVIEEGAISQHIYRIPKSFVGGYNGAEITLNMQYNELVKYEEKDNHKETIESITESIRNTVKSVNENTVDKAMNATKESLKDDGHADNVLSDRTGKLEK
jgi:hypothetical protein